VEETECRLILLEPFLWAELPGEDEYQRNILPRLPEYVEQVRDLAEEFGALLVPTYEFTRRMLAAGRREDMCPDRVHPNVCGSVAIAQLVVQALTV
jgi:hypothetical protein